MRLLTAGIPRRPVSNRTVATKPCLYLSRNRIGLYEFPSVVCVCVNMEDRNDDKDKDKVKNRKDVMSRVKADKEVSEGKTEIEDHKLLSKTNLKNVSATV